MHLTKLLSVLSNLEEDAGVLGVRDSVSVGSCERESAHGGETLLSAERLFEGLG